MEFTYEENINNRENEKVIVHITLDDNKLTSFAIIFLILEQGSYKAIRKYDQSTKEQFNIHIITKKGEKRIEKKKGMTFETIEECILDLKKNWLKYELAFETKGL